MKVTEKKLDDGRILLEAVASTAEVSHALTAAQYRFAQQMGVQPTPGMSVEQAVWAAQEYTWQALAAGFRPGRGQFIPNRFAHSYAARGGEGG